MFIDGQRVVGSLISQGIGLRGTSVLALAEKLSRISAPAIEMVEVYRGLSQIPAEFYEVGACGAVAIWTRYHRETPSAVARDTASPAR